MKPVLLLLLVVLAGCAARSPHAGAAALTTWDCRDPRPWVSIDARILRDTAQLRRVRLHELAHADSAEVLGCRRYHEVLQDPRTLARREAQAIRAERCDTLGCPEH